MGVRYYVDWAGRVWRGPERNSGKRFSLFCGFHRRDGRLRQVWKPKAEMMGEDWEPMTLPHVSRMLALYLEEARRGESSGRSENT